MFHLQLLAAQKALFQQDASNAFLWFSSSKQLNLIHLWERWNINLKKPKWELHQPNTSTTLNSNKWFPLWDISFWYMFLLMLRWIDCWPHTTSYSTRWSAPNYRRGRRRPNQWINSTQTKEWAKPSTRKCTVSRKEHQVSPSEYIGLEDKFCSVNTTTN